MMLRMSLIILFLLEIGAARAQVTSVSDSLRMTPARSDSLLPADSLQTAHWPVLSDSLQFAFPAFWLFPREELCENIFEDSAELLAFLPGQVVFRGGDLGLPVELSSLGSPARFTRVRIDGLDWPVGFYGQTDLNPLPETAADEVRLDTASDALGLHSRWPDMRRMLVVSEYVRGPYGGDALRLRFSRKFSPKLDAYWGGTLAENDGQDEVPGSGSYTGDRIYGRTRYFLRPGLILRYRFLKSRNETTATAPWSFDEMRMDGSFLRKESRWLHSVELAGAALTDSSAYDNPRDRWTLRLYSWDIREEARDREIDVWIRNRMLRSGVIGFKRFYLPGFSASLHARSEWQQIFSPTIDTGGDLFENEITGEITTRDYAGYSGFLSGTVKIHSRFGTLPEARFGLAREFGEGITLYAAAARDVRLPQPGEYANAIPGIMARSDSLSEMQRIFSEIGAKAELANLRLAMRLRSGQYRDEFALTLSDTLLQLKNAADRTNFTTASFYLEAGSSWGGYAVLQMEGRIRPNSEDYLYWYQPNYAGRAELAWNGMVFGGDLGVDILLRSRLVGERRAPLLEKGRLPETVSYQPLIYFDSELRLYFRDAMLFVNVQNIFNNGGEWRPGYPVRPLTIRTGVHWALWD